MERDVKGGGEVRSTSVGVWTRSGASQIGQLGEGEMMVVLFVCVVL